MNNHMDELIERANEKRTMPLDEFIRTEHLENYELGYEDILEADDLNIARIPHEDYMILLRERFDESYKTLLVEYAIYSQEDHDGSPLLNSLNMNATYHLVHVGKETFRNMASAIPCAVTVVENLKPEEEV